MSTRETLEQLENNKSVVNELKYAKAKGTKCTSWRDIQRLKLLENIKVMYAQELERNTNETITSHIEHNDPTDTCKTKQKYATRIHTHTHTRKSFEVAAPHKSMQSMRGISFLCLMHVLRIAMFCVRVLRFANVFLCDISQSLFFFTGFYKEATFVQVVFCSFGFDILRVRHVQCLCVFMLLVMNLPGLQIG